MYANVAMFEKKKRGRDKCFLFFSCCMTNDQKCSG